MHVTEAALRRCRERCVPATRASASQLVLACLTSAASAGLALTNTPSSCCRQRSARFCPALTMAGSPGSESRELDRLERLERLARGAAPAARPVTPLPRKELCG